MAGAEPAGPAGAAILAVPEIRDYRRINAQIAGLLDADRSLIRLAGVEGQRLLLQGLRGGWSGVVVVDGRAGPELAAGLDAPGLLVVCRGGAADGAGRALKAGRLLILGDAGDAVAYGQAGGLVVVAGAAGHRAGLALTGGVLLLLGPAGRLTGERQAGGLILAEPGRLGPHAGRGRRGGRLQPLDRGAPHVARMLDELRPWLPGGPPGAAPTTGTA